MRVDSLRTACGSCEQFTKNNTANMFVVRLATLCCLLYHSASGDLSKLVKVDRSSMGLTEIQEDFSAFPEMEEFDASNNDITYIRPDAFATNTKLKKIDLSGNKHLVLPIQGEFLETSATFLNLSNCNIEYVPGNALDGMKDLDVLDLTKNNLVYEESIAFEIVKTPPKKVLLSTISKAALEFICKNIDLTVSIAKENREVECKDIRRSLNKSNISVKNEEEMTKNNRDVSMDLIEDKLMEKDTHMEYFSDEPVESSGEEPEYENNASEETLNGTNVEAIPIISDDDSTIPLLNKEPEKNNETLPSHPVPDIIKSDSIEPEETVPDNVGQDSNKPDSIVPDSIVPNNVGPDSKVPDNVSAESQPPGIRRGFIVPPKAPETFDETETVDIARNGEPEVGEDKQQTSSSSTVILFVILGVVIVGTGLVAFRYIRDRKNRATYDAVNGGGKDETLQGRELTEIKTEKGDGKTPESSPLMREGPDVEFREVTEKIQKPPRASLKAGENIGEQNKDVDGTDAVPSDDKAARDLIANSRAELPHIDDENYSSKQNVNE